MIRKVLFLTAALLVAVAMAGTKGMNLGSTETSHQAFAQDTISKDEAGKIATDKYGGDIINVEKEHEDGNLVYEVEIKNSKQGRIEVDVDAYSGEIVGMEKEDSDNDDGDDNGDNDNSGKESSDNDNGDNNDGDGDNNNGTQ